MIITVLQILFVLFLIVLVILIIFKPRKTENFALPEHYKDLLNDYVKFYANLDEDGKKKFEERLQKFLSSVKITGANAEVEDLDRVLIGAGALIPVYFIPDWQYVNLHEVLVYPGSFNYDYDQHGTDRNIAGMVGTGPMQNVMILSKWELRNAFINSTNNRNTIIHEFVHLVDKMDGTFDGVPELLLERKCVQKWLSLIDATIYQIKQGQWLDIDTYAATNRVEFFAVISEYFFEQPEMFRLNHPELNEMLEKIFIKTKVVTA